MSQQALLREAHHTTHIEGMQLTLAQAERLWSGEAVAEARDEDTRELLNYRDAGWLDYFVTGRPSCWPKCWRQAM
jgi:Fic family protein